MQEKAGQFRAAAFGGFHRQDVLHYIEQLTREHQANCERLERELTEERTARQQAEEQARQAEAQAAEAEKSPGRPGQHAGSHTGRTGEDHHCPALTQAKATAKHPWKKNSRISNQRRLPGADQRHGRRH